MEIYRANGTNRAAFLAGIVDKYSWVGVGTSYFLSDILASIVTEQLKKLPAIQKKRTDIAKRYSKALSPYRKLIQLPTVPKNTVPNWHIYAVVFSTKQHRDIFLQKMRKIGIDVAYHYVPLHSSEMGKRLAFKQGAHRVSSFDSSHQGPDRSDVHRDIPAKAVMGLEKTRRAELELPVTESIWERLVRLPIYPGLTKKELDYIISSARSVLTSLT
jgi:dTDP-4-amino-4,6-dideoxygalactose transaminase